ncbi:MAG: 2-oxo acid dehydrogenase subunit E2, partial [Candidatus Brocadiae bacterium]|nr:2-oxo acid dehydrogenase subunit E2 [Candidatus Brocadiia bacterium]
PAAEPTTPGRVPASPRARRIARERKVPLAALRGSGPGGRIIERDVRAYLAELEGIAYTPAAASYAYAEGVSLLDVARSAGGRRVRKEDVQRAVESGLRGARVAAGAPAGQRVALSPMRRTIAARMAAAKQAVPHFYLVGEIGMRAATEFLQDFRALTEERVTVTGLLVKAVGLVLKQHPRMNARFDGDAVVLNAARNVGVAVAVEDGLFVPVIKDADAKGLVEISSELRSLAETARAGKLIPEQYEGGSITISNLGQYGVEYFLPIVNPPETCIVGVGAIVERPVAEGGELRVEPIMKVSLSADHRVTNGAEAAEFLQTLRELLEEPSKLGA